MKPTGLPQGHLTVWGGRLTLKLQQIASIRWYDDGIADVHMAGGKEYAVKGEDYRALRNALVVGESK